MKIGEIIEIKQDFELETLNKRKISVKKGDKGFIDKRGLVHYISGEARGIIQAMAKDTKIKGFDTESISKLVYRHLNNLFDMGEILEEQGIKEKDFKEEIEEVLDDIL